MVSSNKRKIKKADQKFIDDLEKVNLNIRKKLKEFKQDGSNNWTTFKDDVSHEIDEIGKSISRMSGHDKK